MIRPSRFLLLAEQRALEARGPRSAPVTGRGPRTAQWSRAVLSERHVSGTRRALSWASRVSGAGVPSEPVWPRPGACTAASCFDCWKVLESFMFVLHILSWECYLNLSRTAEQDGRLVERTSGECKCLIVLGREGHGPWKGRGSPVSPGSEGMAGRSPACTVSALALSCALGGAQRPAAPGTCSARACVLPHCLSDVLWYLF